MDNASAPSQPSWRHTYAGPGSSTLAALNASAVDWAGKIGFPAAIGTAVIERAQDAAQTYNRASEADRQIWIREQIAQFERLVGGPEQAQAKTKLAAKALARAPGAFSDALHTNGALHDAGIVMWLANQGERLTVRGG